MSFPPQWLSNPCCHPHLIPQQSRISPSPPPLTPNPPSRFSILSKTNFSNLKMDWSLLRNPNLTPPPPPPATPVLAPINQQTNISPSVFLIIVVIAIVFFISGLLHLLARVLLRPSTADPEETGSATAIQGQLRQLFDLHDSGVDQSFIDALPLFLYKAIIGVKDPFDCAVCLCEFEPEDKLRLLPKCSHAFHLGCIDTWLLSHSTCPLCRRSLVSELSPGCSPRLFFLESGSGSGNTVEGCSDGEDDHLNPAKAVEDDDKEAAAATVEKVVSVKLGKLKNVDGAGGGEGSSTGNSNLDRRRCFSMGSFEYVMDEHSTLQVPIKPTKKKPLIGKPGHRLVMSDCDGNSQRYGCRELVLESGGGASIKRESFSISKIWLRSKATRDSSTNANSFRLALYRGASGESKAKGGSRRTVSELDVAEWSKNGSEFGECGSDVEIGSCNYSMGSQVEKAPSFARRTLLWIAGRQNRVVNLG